MFGILGLLRTPESVKGILGLLRTPESVKTSQRKGDWYTPTDTVCPAKTRKGTVLPIFEVQANNLLDFILLLLFPSSSKPLLFGTQT